MANDTCSNAIALTAHAAGDSQTVTGDTTNATDKYESNVCSGFGHDVFYSLTLSSAAEVTLTLTPGNAANDSVVDLLSACAGQELGCGYSPTAGTAAMVHKYTLTAGTYIVVVDNYGGEDGPFTLQVDLAAAATPPQGESCSNARALTDQDGGFFTASGTTVDAGSNYASYTCGGYGNEVFYAVHLDAGADITATLTPMTTADGGMMQGVLDFASGCSNETITSEMSCANSSSDGGTTLHVIRAAAGDHYLIVDSSAYAPEGAYNVSVALAPPTPAPANDTCAGAIALDASPDGGWPDGGAAVVLGDTTAASYDYSVAPGVDGGNNCVGYPFADGLGHDEVYSFTPATTGSYTITLTPTTLNDDVVLYVVNTCPTAPVTSCMGADQGVGGEAETVTATLTAGTTYLIIADGYSSTDNGPFTLGIVGP